MKPARRRRVFAFVLFALASFGCMAAVDDDGAGSSSAPEGAVGASSQALSSPALTTSIESTELAPVIDGVDLSIDPTQTEIASSTCRRVCACCKNNGNRFCCSHCRFCSGPIGPIGVSGGVLAP